MSYRLTKLCFKLFQQKAKASCFCVRRWHQKLHLLQWRQLHRPRALLRLSTRLHRAPVGNNIMSQSPCQIMELLQITATHLWSGKRCKVTDHQAKLLCVKVSNASKPPLTSTSAQNLRAGRFRLRRFRLPWPSSSCAGASVHVVTHCFSRHVWY